MKRTQHTLYRSSYRWELKRWRYGIKLPVKSLEELARTVINQQLLVKPDVEQLPLPPVLKDIVRENYNEDKKKSERLRLSQQLIDELSTYTFQDTEQEFTIDHKIILFNWEPTFGTIGVFERNKVHYSRYIRIDKNSRWWNSRYECERCAWTNKLSGEKIIHLTGTHGGKYLNEEFLDVFVQDYKNWCQHCPTCIVSVTDADDWDDWLNTPYHFSNELDESCRPKRY